MTMYSEVNGCCFNPLIMGWDGMLLGNMFQNQNLELDVGFCYNRNAKHVLLN